MLVVGFFSYELRTGSSVGVLAAMVKVKRCNPDLSLELSAPFSPSGLFRKVE